MTRLFRSKSCGLVGLTEFNKATPSPFFHHNNSKDDEDDGEDEELEYDSEDCNDGCRISRNPISTPFINSGKRFGGGDSVGQSDNSTSSHQSNNQFQILDIVAAALRKSLVTCSVEREDVSSTDISWPTEVRHVSHVTFDQFNGFLGLPTELEPDVPRTAPSASVRVFGVSAKSMQCSYDKRGNSVPTILLMMQKRLYSGGGLKAEGIFRINAENSQEEYVRDQLNRGIVPRGIDVHCLAGLIKAWFRELPIGVLDSLTPEQVMRCNTEEDCTKLVKLLPPTEAALLSWSINLMADVVHHERCNKMNARNIAMVFAPNMTQMADPLTALIHAVQVMNFLKTLILKNLREREESTATARLLSPCTDSSTNENDSHSSNINADASFELNRDPCAPGRPASGKFLRAATLGRLESDAEDKFWNLHKKSDGEEEFEYGSGSSTPALFEKGASENGFRGGYNNGNWLSLRRGARRLCRHPVFHLGKPAKKTRNLGIVNTREGSEEETCA